MINGKISQIKNKNGEVSFPVTTSKAVYMQDGTTTVEKKFEEVNSSLDHKATYYDLDYIKPEWFSEYNVLDSTIAIQKSIDLAIQNNRGQTILIEGTHKISSITIKLPESLNNQEERLKFIKIKGGKRGKLISLRNATEPMIQIKSDDATLPVDWGRMMRDITIEDLQILSNEHYNTTNIDDRIGLNIVKCQNVRLENVLISGFSEALVLDTVFDSHFYNVQIFRSGNSSAGKYAMSLRATTSDCTNACHFVGLHIEHCPLMIEVKQRARHNYFTNCKFEQSASNTSLLSPIYIKDSEENSFSQCMMVQNEYVDTLPYFIKTINNATVRFTDCDFATPTKVEGAKWLDVESTIIDKCYFAKTNGNGYAFKLNEDNIFTNNYINIVSTTSNVFNLVSNNNNIKNVTIKFNVNGNQGAIFNVSSTCDFNNVTDINFINLNSNIYTISSSEVYLRNNSFKNIGSFAKKDVSSSVEPSVFMSEFLTSTVGANVTYFKHGYNGKKIIFNTSTTGNKIIYDPAKIILKGRVDKTFTNDESIQFLCVSGVWYEI